LERRSFEPGDYLFREGDTSRELYMLLSGEVQVVKLGKVIATVTENGAFLGEMSFLLEKPRVASVYVSQPSEFMVVDDPGALVESQPMIMIRMARVIAQRLDDLEERLLAHRRQQAQ